MEAPKKVIEAFEYLKGSGERGLILRSIKGGFYVYRERGVWSKDLKRSKPVFEYLGSISKSGIFKRKGMSELEAAKFIIQSNGGKVTLPEIPREYNQTDKIIAEEDERRILTILSMNGRATLDLISTMTNLPKSTVYNKINVLKKRYGIRYFADMDTEKLGYFRYLIFVKFNELIPDYEEVKRITEKESCIQFAAFTSGKYDLVIHILSKSHRDMAYFIYRLRAETSLNRYPSVWYTTPYYSRKHVFPLREEFFELLKDKIWKRSAERPRPEKDDFTEREYNVLLELNRNGECSFTEIDEKYGYGRGTSRYTYLRLKERGVINNITITLEKIPIKYSAVFLLEHIDMNSFRGTRQNLLFEAIKDGPLIDKYSITGNIDTPDSYLLVMPVFNEDEMIETEGHIKKNVEGIKLSTMILVKTIVGSLCYRRLDKTYTNQYRLLVEEYKLLKPSKQVNYDK